MASYEEIKALINRTMFDAWNEHRTFPGVSFMQDIRNYQSEAAQMIFSRLKEQGILQNQALIETNGYCRGDRVVCSGEDSYMAGHVAGFVEKFPWKHPITRIESQQRVCPVVQQDDTGILLIKGFKQLKLINAFGREEKNEK